MWGMIACVCTTLLKCYSNNGMLSILAIIMDWNWFFGGISDIFRMKMNFQGWPKVTHSTQLWERVCVLCSNWQLDILRLKKTFQGCHIKTQTDKHMHTHTPHLIVDIYAFILSTSFFWTSTHSHKKYHYLFLESTRNKLYLKTFCWAYVWQFYVFVFDDIYETLQIWDFGKENFFFFFIQKILLRVNKTNGMFQRCVLC